MYLPYLGEKLVWTGRVKQIDEVRWEIPQQYKSGMLVPARIYADAEMLDEMRKDLTLEQAANVSFLRGIYKYSVTLPDGHQGYSGTSNRFRAKGFPLGAWRLRMRKQGSSVPAAWATT